MSLNKRQKMDPDAASSSTSANTPETSTRSVLRVGIQTDQQTAGPAKEASSAAPEINTMRVSQKIFDANVAKFKEAVRWRGFVDKTLLIKGLMTGTKRVLVCAPKRFGKSMNIDMVKCFFEIERNRGNVKNQPENIEELERFENYRAFRRVGKDGTKFGEECKILKERQLVRKHFGRHPVVKLKFKNIDVTSCQDVKYSMRILIHKAYLEHAYLMDSNSLANDEEVKEFCEEWCDVEKHKESSAIYGFHRLIEYLHAYHGRKVYLLIDDIDAPATNALLKCKDEKEVQDIVRVVMRFLDQVLIGSEADEHLLGALLSGVSFLMTHDFTCDWIGRIPDKRFLQSVRFVDYYGLTEEELLILLKAIPENERNDARKQIVQLYNGYYYEQKPIYCLWSVLHFVQNCLEPSAESLEFWDGCSLIRDLAGSLKDPYIIEDMLRLIGGEQITIGQITYRYGYLDASSLSDFFQMGLSKEAGQRFDNNRPDTSSVFPFFFDQGYLISCNRDENINSYFNHVKIPNDEIMKAYRDMFTNFYVGICGFSETEMEDCASIVREMPSGGCLSDGNLDNKLQDVYEHLTKLFKKFKEQKGVNKLALKDVMYCMMYEIAFKKGVPEKIFKFEERTSDRWLLGSDHFVVILKLNYNEGRPAKKSSKDALNKILAGILDPNIENYLLIELSMGDGDCLPSINCLVNVQGLKDCISFPRTA